MRPTAAKKGGRRRRKIAKKEREGEFLAGAEKGGKSRGLAVGGGAAVGGGL